MIKKIIQTIHKAKNTSVLIHAITNPISINQCANTALAVGAKPIMAEHPKEVQQITNSADALFLNLGNITDARIKSMKISKKSAVQNNIPVVLDLVGINCSKLRRKLALRLIPCSSIIKGNYSEINTLYNNSYHSSGVDADETLSRNYISKVAVSLSEKYRSIILASGSTDIITDGKTLIYVNNGTPRLTAITGTGCMLGMLTACFSSVTDSLTACVTASVLMGIGGELSEAQQGNAGFAAGLIDNLSTITEEEIIKLINTEEKSIEYI